MAKPMVFVIGATGNIGASTVIALSTKYAAKVEIRAGVRDPEKAGRIKSLAGVTVVQATMGDEKLEQVLSGVDTLFINTPGTPNRAQLTTSTAEMAKKAGVKHIVVVSIPLAKATDTIIGHQFTEIEGEIPKLDIPYTFICLPAFIENYWRFKSTIANQGKIFSPVDPEKPFKMVSVKDAGNASAAIMVDPSSYANKTITLVSDFQDLNEVVQAFSAALGKEVKYIRVPYEDTKKRLLETGMPELVVNGIIELYKLVDNSHPSVSHGDVGDLTAITGAEPTDLKKWLAENAKGFQ